MQRGKVGDITAGLPLGPWTEELAAQFMTQNELGWDEFGVTGDEREAERRELTERFRRHIEAGDLCYAYVAYPYIEWYSDNGRMVLELDRPQLEIVEKTSTKPKTPAELREDSKKRTKAFGSFMAEMGKSLSEENRKQGGDGNITGIVVG